MDSDLRALRGRFEGVSVMDEMLVSLARGWHVVIASDDVKGWSVRLTPKRSDSDGIIRTHVYRGASLSLVVARAHAGEPADVREESEA